MQECKSSENVNHLIIKDSQQIFTMTVTFSTPTLSLKVIKTILTIDVAFYLFLVDGALYLKNHIHFKGIY